MNLKTIQDNISWIVKENAWGRMIILALIIVNASLGYKLFNHNPIVTYVPYTLKGPATIMKDKADTSMHMAWSLYLAEVFGNVTPDTVDFVKTTIKPLLAPEIRNEMLTLLDSQIVSIKSSGTSFSFEPKDVTPDLKEGVTYVVGRHSEHKRYGDPIRTNRTYEFQWDFESYMPVLKYMTTYPGAPRTEVQE